MLFQSVCEKLLDHIDKYAPSSNKSEQIFIAGDSLVSLVLALNENLKLKSSYPISCQIISATTFEMFLLPIIYVNYLFPHYYFI